MERTNVAGMSMKGGRKDKFYFCLLEYYPDQDRWFLRSLLQVKDEDGQDGDEAIRNWIEDYDLKQLVVDFPLTTPECEQCTLECPGVSKCPQFSVKEVRKRINEVLNEDQKLRKKNPKAYEQARNRDDEIDFSRNILDKQSNEHLLSRSFKRRVKKGFLPYWNRSVDFWVWSHYYDQLLNFFNISYDSFGNTSLMILSRFSYLKRHFPSDLELYEGNNNIALLELLRSKVLLKKDIDNLSDIVLGAEARLDIIKKIEDKLKIFIYDHDLEILAKNPRAFESFLLSVSGQCLKEDRVRDLPDWTLPNETRFIAPHF